MKKLRMILPAAAVVLAAAGALATNITKEARFDDPVEVSIVGVNNCPLTHSCIPGGEVDCALGLTKFAVQTGDPATCAIPLKGTYDE